MLKILNVRIQRFRSIMDLSFDVNLSSNLVTICGQNNIGKTNVLRAINIFFNPDMYVQQSDIPVLKVATWGGSVHPKIEINFHDTRTLIYYCITRDFKPEKDENSIISGNSFKGSLKRKLDKKDLSKIEVEAILQKTSFIYIESINTLVPDLINGITQEVLTLEFDKSRFTKSKKALKEAYDNYVDGLQEILNAFSKSISTTFRDFKDNWEVKFNVPKNSDNFRDLISDDVTLQIQDKGSRGIEDKGSGLQRLAHILMEFEAADKISAKKNVIICIDEPDLYLHEGLQRKLKDFIDKKSLKMQILYTTHSKIFIDTYKLENIILLSCKHFEQFVTRKQKTINVIETINVDLTTDEGHEKICNHLGIEKDNFEILDRFNILTEGNSDKRYLEELSRFFNVKSHNIISVNGADNMDRYLDFYNSYYKNHSSFKPKIKVVLDNDSKGRDIYKKLIVKKYNWIEVICVLLNNFTNSSNKDIERNNTNNEMEDFLYPELVCYLINTILNKKGLKTFSDKYVCTNCQKPSFSATGILNLCENKKNEVNPEKGNEIIFTSSSRATDNFKESMAGLMKIEGNSKLIDLLYRCDKKYPAVRQTIEELMRFDD